MKKLILAAFLFAASAVVVTVTPQYSFAKSGGTSVKIPASSVPAAVMYTFKARFANATKVEWEYEREDYGRVIYEASFYLGSQRWKAKFSATGAFLGVSVK